MPALRRPGLLALAALLAAGAAARPEEPVKVTVVAVLASDKHSQIDPKLQDLARQVQKRDPTLTGFRVGRITCLPLKVGQKETFPLTDDASAEVTVLQPEGKEQKPRLSIKPPQMGEFVIETCCGKFFPVFTRCRTEKEQEQVILAVMVKPCPKKEKP
jgi:hypothetical protein